MKLFTILVCTFLSFSVHGQTGKVIKGIVTDKQYTPIPFCGVSIKGTKISAITNNCGEFELFVKPEDFTIVFNYGFVPFERRIKQKEIKNEETVIFLIKKPARATNKECKKKVSKKMRKLVVNAPG